MQLGNITFQGGTLRESTTSWTNAVTTAFNNWANLIVSDITVNVLINVQSSAQWLASVQSLPIYDAGQTSDGTDVVLPRIPAAMQDGTQEITFTINVSNNFDWAMGTNAEPNKFHATTVMMHEIGHILYHTHTLIGNTPYELYIEQHDVGITHQGGLHSTDTGQLMHTYINKNQKKQISDADKVGLSTTVFTINDDRVAMLENAVFLDGGAGDDIVVWYGSYDELPRPAMVNIETLELLTLNSGQIDVYFLYQAAFARDPDLGGFDYWAGTTYNIYQLAEIFTYTEEFVNAFDLSDRYNTITDMYGNILGREPAPTEIDYWVGRTDLEVYQILAFFADSAENTTNQGDFWSFSVA